MQYKDFYNYVQEIQNFYGKKLNEKELEVWYENLKFMSIQRFNYIIAEIYKTSPFLPKLSQILELHKSIPYVSTTKPEDINGDCKKCGNTGYVVYTKIIEGHKYLYSAVCDCGRQVRYDGRQCQDERNKSNYYCPTIKEIGLEIKSNRPSREQVIASMIKVKDSKIVSKGIKDIVRQAISKK